MSSEVKRCSRCILPENYPGIKFNDNGICSICLDYDKRWLEWKKTDYKKSQEELNIILAHAKKQKRKYDCIVPFSGGKDSTYILYLCKKVYNLNVLALNFNNGFQSETAIENIKNTVNTLGVDMLHASTDWNVLKKLYTCFLLKAGEFCTPCNMGIILSTYAIAEKEKIPLVLYGNSPRTDERSVEEIYTCSRDYFLNVLKGNGLLNLIKGTIYEQAIWSVSLRYKVMVKLNAALAKFKLYNYGFSTLVINLPDFIEWNEKVIYDAIVKELSWGGFKNVGEEHNDCRIANVKSYLRWQRWGFGAKTQKMSSLVRDGQISREEALKRIAEEGKEPAEEINYLVRKLDLSNDCFAEIKNSYHLKYV